jgi:hypothetical protein
VRAFAIGLALLGALAQAAAADWDSLVVGQPLADSELRIGQFKLKLPEGPWVTAAKFEARVGSQTGSSGSPVQLSATFARVENAIVTALFTVRTPAATFIGIRSWMDDPCRGVEGKVLVVDTMKQTFSMPECFTVMKYDSAQMTNATQGYNGQIASWMKQANAALPPKVWRVYYSKYYGGDFIHTFAYFPAAEGQTHAAAESWGRQAAAAIQAMVTRNAPLAALPPIP